MTDFKKLVGDINSSRIKFLISQEVSDEIEEGVKILKEIYEVVKMMRGKMLNYQSLR